jgi:hypothetical protein
VQKTRKAGKPQKAGAKRPHTSFDTTHFFLYINGQPYKKAKSKKAKPSKCKKLEGSQINSPKAQKSISFVFFGGFDLLVC